MTPQEGRTYDQLYNEAKERGIRGRSKMSKAELARAEAPLALRDPGLRRERLPDRYGGADPPGNRSSEVNS